MRSYLLSAAGLKLAFLCLAIIPTIKGANEQWGANLITNYQIRNVGGSGSAWVSIQDRHGRMYFGCETVLRFDGESWTSHSPGQGTVVRALAIDAENRLWVGARDEVGYFALTPDGPSAFVSIRHLVPSEVGPLEDVWVVEATKFGVFFVETDAVLRWDGTKFQSWTMPERRRLNLFHTNGQVFLISAKGVLRFNGSGWEELVPEPLTRRLTTEWMEANDQGYLLGTWSGFHRLVNGELRTGKIPLARRSNGDVFADACRYDKDTIVAAIIGRGIVFFDEEGNIKRTIGFAQGLSDVETTSVFVDRDGGLWTTTRNHITRISPALGISYFGAAHGVRGPAVSLTNFGHKLVVATNEGLSAIDTESREGQKVFESLPSFRGNLGPIQSLGDGSLLVAGFGTLFVTDGNEKTNVPLIGRDIEGIYPSHKEAGKYFLTTTAGGLMWRPGEDLVEIPSFPVNPLGIQEDEHGNLWVGTRTRGLAFLKRENRQFRRGIVPPGIPDTVTQIQPAAVGDKIIAYTRDRTFATDGPNHAFREVEQLRGETIEVTYSTAARDDAWALVSIPNLRGIKNLAVAKLRSSRDGLQVDYYDIPGIDRIGSARDIHLQESGGEPILWFSGTSGVLRVPLSAIKPPTPPLQPLLRPRFREEENQPAADGRPTLPFRANRLAFDWAVTDYERRDQLLFETRLVGLEAEWSAPQAASRREFPFLQEGDYRFEVRTLSPAGLASSVATWDFTILPPWWRTRWAYASYALATGLLLVGADRVRIRALRRRTEWLEEQVRARTAELEKANAAKTEFVARVNHDIRNPINGVLGLTLTLEQTALDDEQRRMTGTIKQCAKFLSSLVEEVLDFAEIESGAIKIRTDRFDLREAVAASVATIDPLARSAGSPVAVEVDPALPEQLGGDTARVQQILVNFLSNAVKFGAGRPITVTARALHQIGPRLFVRLAVRDQGPGLSAAEQAQLFRKFSRLRFAEEQKIKGTGLGLAVCRLLAERMGGRVGVESAPGTGAEFFLELPFDLAAAAAEETQLSPVATNARVLVVEDEDYNAISLLAMLKGMGFTADRCADGQSALEKLQRERYDIVFLDWELPRLNGIEVARRYRATEPPDRRTLIIATTAYASADKRDACRAAGMDEFVAKPVTPERITIAIRGHASVFTPATSILVREEPNTPAGPDLSLFAYLADGEGGVEAKVNEFIAACEKELAELNTYAAAGRADELRRAAHRFLSQCRFVGATRLAGLALDLEQRSEQPRGPEVRHLLENLRAEFAAFRNELRSSLDAQAAAESAPSRSRSG